MRDGLQTFPPQLGDSCFTQQHRRRGWGDPSLQNAAWGKEMSVGECKEVEGLDTQIKAPDELGDAGRLELFRFIFMDFLRLGNTMFS